MQRQKEARTQKRKTIGSSWLNGSIHGNAEYRLARRTLHDDLLIARGQFRKQGQTIQVIKENDNGFYPSSGGWDFRKQRTK